MTGLSALGTNSSSPVIGTETLARPRVSSTTSRLRSAVSTKTLLPSAPSTTRPSGRSHRFLPLARLIA